MSFKKPTPLVSILSKIISIASGKGGTGKSTVCVTLGMALVKRGHTVLLIDCDSGMRGLDIMMGISKSLVFDIADAVCGNCTPEQIIYPCNHIAGLSLIPAPQNAEDELSPAILKQFTDNIRDNYDYIIIDSPAGVGKGFDTAVLPADLCLVIANTEPTSLRGCVNVRKKLTEYGKDNIRDYLHEEYKPTTNGIVLVVVATMFYGEILERGGGKLKQKYKVISQISSDVDMVANKYKGSVRQIGL